MDLNEVTEPARPDAAQPVPQQPHDQSQHAPDDDAETRGFGTGQPAAGQPEAGQPEVEQGDHGAGENEQLEQHTPPRPPLSTNPDMPERFQQAARALDEIDQRPVADHAETYDAVHRDLRAVLDDVDQSG